MSLVHHLNPPGKGGFLDLFNVHTEIGCELMARDLFVENRIEYSPSPRTDSRYGLTSRLEHGDLRIMLTASSAELYGFYRGRPQRISGHHVYPESGAIHGTVFLDSNANGVREPDEPGVSDVRVIGDSQLSAQADRSGYFVLPGSSRVREHRVYLDLDTVPADFSPTHGIQTAYVIPYDLTEVNLGLVPAHSVSGQVVLNGRNGKPEPMQGVRVIITRRGGEKVVADSVTTSDGTYYLGDIRPGRYLVRVDMRTLPETYTLEEPTREVEVLPLKNAQEVRPKRFEIGMRNGGTGTEHAQANGTTVVSANRP